MFLKPLDISISKSNPDQVAARSKRECSDFVKPTYVKKHERHVLLSQNFSGKTNLSSLLLKLSLNFLIFLSFA